MPPSERFPYQIVFVQEAERLRDCVEQLKKQQAIAVDLEFDKDRVFYGFTLSLIQIAADSTIYVIDAMCGLELTELFKVFKSPEIEKIMHCPGEDLRLLHALNCFPTPLFDNEIAAKLCNFEQTSLAAMLQQLLGIQLDKTLQKSDWTKRPLTEAQIDYAAQDVVYLVALKQALLNRAKEMACEHFILQEQQLLSQQRYPIEKRDNFLKKDDYLLFTFKERILLNELLRYRDQVAASLNLPAYRTMDEQVIRDICKGKTTTADWMNLKGLHPKLRTTAYQTAFTQQIETIRAAIKAGQLPKASEKPEEQKYVKREFETGKERKEELKQRIFNPVQQALSERLGTFAFRFVLSSALVNDLIHHKTTIREIKPSYKQELILAAADKLNIDLQAFL